MKIHSQTLIKSQMELTIEISQEELDPFLKKAAKHIAGDIKIPGFRPGKAPYDVVKQQVGEMKIHEAAADLAIKDTIFEAIDQEHLEIVGQPKVDIEKIAPGNPLVYKATVSLLPKVELMDYKKLKVKAKEVKIEEKQVDKVLKDLRKMQTKEALVDREAREKDKVVVDMDMYRDRVPVDGGQTKGHQIYLDEEYYIPGMKEQLIGMKKSETKEFNLKFPKDHYQKNLAGKPVDFKVTLKDVYELTPPELNDEFAKTMGQESMVRLRELLKKNLTTEAQNKEEQRQEIEMLEKIVEKSKFDDIPEVLINNEVEKMLAELEHSVARQGGEFKKYLESIKKTVDDLKLDFVPQAIKRVKTALVIRIIAEEERIEVADKEIEEDVKKTLEAYKNNEKMKEGIESPQGREYVKNLIVNRKTIKFLKDLIVK